jgi:serine/threonine protein phosphatase PrpC
MEDTVSLRLGFHTWTDGSPMHIFAIFDGHGGSFVRIRITCCYLPSYISS